MTKNEFLEVLIPELKRLEEVEHLRDLIKNECCAEAEAVFDEIDYSSFYKYVEECIDGKECRLEVSDIPEEYLVTFMIYLQGNGEYTECDVMMHWEELETAVEKMPL